MNMKRLLLGFVFLSWTLGVAAGAPPASCRDKFVGTWKYFGGSTEVRADGTAVPSKGVKYQTWTCSGNQYIFSNPDGQTFTSTLSADGNKLVGAGTATRVGAAAREPAAKHSSKDVDTAKEACKEVAAVASEIKTVLATISSFQLPRNSSGPDGQRYFKVLADQCRGARKIKSLGSNIAAANCPSKLKEVRTLISKSKKYYCEKSELYCYENPDVLTCKPPGSGGVRG